MMNNEATISSTRLWCLILLFSVPLLGQTGYREMSSRSAVILKEETYFTKPLQIIDAPTASMLRGGDFRAGVRIFQDGGMLATLSAGISNKVMFGISFGGTNVIGNEQQIIWNNMPGVHVIYRIFDESMRLPAFVIGFDSQGAGPYYSDKTVKQPLINDVKNDSLDRYDFKSRGFYCVVSKGYSSLINAGLHAGISYSLERGGETKRSPTIFMATNAHVARDLAVLVEYDFAIHDSKWYSKGILNMGLRWAFGSNIFLDFDLQNLLGSKDDKSDVRRVVNLSYYGSVMR
jgi:hypothetical protein